jgi:hypothetical protein
VKTKFQNLPANPILIAVVIFFASLVSMVWHTQSPYISLWDEMYHLSYVQYAFSGRIPVPLDAMGSWSRYVFSCVEVYPNGFVTALKCGQILPLEAFPEAGRNSSAHWTPVYYFFTALLMKPILWILSEVNFHPGDFWLAARIGTSVLWSIGCTSVFVVTRKVFRTTTGAISVSLLLCSLPFVFYNGSFVTPYSLAPVVVGIQLATAHILVSRVDTYSKTLKAIALSATTFSVWALPQSITVILILSFAIVIYEFLDGSEHVPDKWMSTSHVLHKFRSALALLAVGLLGYVSYSRWTLFQQSRSLPQPVLPEGAFTQLKDNTFSNLDSFQFFFFYAWPKSIFKWEFLDFNEMIIGITWAVIATLGIFSALFQKNQSRFVRFIAIAFIAAAPFVGLTYDLILPFGPPMRYFLPVAILGLTFVASLSNRLIERNAILWLSIATYGISFTLPAFQAL